MQLHFPRITIRLTPHASSPRSRRFGHSNRMHAQLSLRLRAHSAVLALAFSLSALPQSPAQEISITPAAAQGIYQPGDTIRWNLQAKGSNVTSASYVLKQGGLIELTNGRIAFATDGKAQVETKSAEPGWMLLEVKADVGGGKTTKALGGALVAPEKIQPALPRPADFDEFWQMKLKELASVPANPQLTPGDAGRTNLDYWKITMDNIRGTHIHGQLARPKQGSRFPAMLIVQWAGVYPLQKGWVIERASEGWLALNIMAHDLPIDEPAQFYSDLTTGRLKDYPAIGNTNRESSYFLRMYLSCFRAAQYLAERPDWNGQTLVVTGTSQGGMQTLVTAALHPRITAAMACVPAGCDLNGPQAGRLPGWPMWYWATQGKEEKAVRNAARYYDAVNFAAGVKCPVLIGVGLIDTTCPSPGVFAAFNQLSGPKEIVPLPLAEHQDKNSSHGPYFARFSAWNRALVKDQPAPVK